MNLTYINFLFCTFKGKTLFYAHEFSQTHERICPHELFEADPSLSLRAVILKVVNVVSKVRGDQLIKCIISSGAWARNKDFTEEIYPRKGRRIVVLSLELGSILGAQIYTGLTGKGMKCQWCGLGWCWWWWRQWWEVEFGCGV